MVAYMVVSMTITDPSWVDSYFATVPDILAQYGAVSLAGSRKVTRVEGKGQIPQRIAIFTFPSLDAIDLFMADERYRPFRQMREQGASSEILVFENAVSSGELI